ncbi:putative serine/threonine protein kinase [Actinacidiphila reveromycinica]|uniref:Putative serine/threonine protein kinase n=1 Tax=Actinacidiphila reveromycinica TaxID=659352 RepID=A0A7U3UT32_9ACTN|nr:serine/threonine-protein kinase [Streptomyces sp. SN-593]BBA98246.1 putative serine/threonine protein kinase [Streptomyces sp. SN-593]
MEELKADDPRWIGAYRLLGRLGVGGMGQVFLARSERGRTVAVKLVRPHLAEQDEFRSRFRREVGAARRVGGRWTAPVLDADTEAAVPWVATGYVPGPSLQQVVGKDHGPLPERSVRVLAAGLARALADIHGAGLVHRDLKPSNVMITIDGPRVIDFGIARALETVTDASLTGPGAMVGSPAFMSPEQVRGDRVTPACDVFCLGSVLAYAATGLQPFGAAGSGVHAQMFRIVQEPPDLDAVPEGLRDLVAACLTKDPQGRPSLAEVERMLAPAGADGPSGPEGPEGPEGPGRGDGPDGLEGGDGEPWLPGAIVAQLGRHAVRLLELEAEAEAPAESASGAAQTETPAEAQSAGPSSGPGGAPREDEAPPTAPPPPTAYAPTYTSWPERPSAPGTPAPAATAPGAAAPAGPAVAPPLPPAPSPSAPPAAPRRRRGSIAASVAALVLVAGGATAYVAVRDGGKDSAGPEPDPTASTHAPTPTGSGTRDAAPAGAGGFQDMVGTWRTSFTSDDNGDNTRTLTVHASGDVELSGDSASYACFWDMKVTADGPPVRLSPSKVVTGTPASSCSPGDASTLSLVDPTHLRRSDVDDGKAPLTYTKVTD